ncbi:MAG TPA: hypothetical protein PLU85_09760 [Bacteroidia bacterium]|nr:MAG: hypothetical protein IPJ93_09955 [Bacteroidota bacterium]HOZ83424.1 hypothetical protein [Bacteroidia bacterium]HQW19010.1 hypothetical protein [Bacteroidia bacterium]HRA60732.1 hypothetical protein [Bacteroidia bacterium]HRB26265.1 hypothetical protein [Bacteroidia bacterium]
MNIHASQNTPYYSRSPRAIGSVAAYIKLLLNVPLLFAVVFLVSRMAFSFTQNFHNKKRPNRFALINEVQARLQTVSFIEMVQQQTKGKNLLATKSIKTHRQQNTAVKKYLLQSAFYNGGYIDPPKIETKFS